MNLKVWAIAMIYFLIISLIAPAFSQEIQKPPESNTSNPSQSDNDDTSDGVCYSLEWLKTVSIDDPLFTSLSILAAPLCKKYPQLCQDDTDGHQLRNDLYSYTMKDGKFNFASLENAIDKNTKNVLLDESNIDSDDIPSTNEHDPTPTPVNGAIVTAPSAASADITNSDFVVDDNDEDERVRAILFNIHLIDVDMIRKSMKKELEEKQANLRKEIESDIKNKQDQKHDNNTDNDNTTITRHNNNNNDTSNYEDDDDDNNNIYITYNIVQRHISTTCLLDSLHVLLTKIGTSDKRTYKDKVDLIKNDLNSKVNEHLDILIKGYTKMANDLDKNKDEISKQIMDYITKQYSNQNNIVGLHELDSAIIYSLS